MGLKALSKQGPKLLLFIRVGQHALLFLSFVGHIITQTQIFVHHPGDCLSSSQPTTASQSPMNCVASHHRAAKEQKRKTIIVKKSSRSINKSTYTLNQYHIVSHGITTIHNMYPTSTTQVTLVLGTAGWLDRGPASCPKPLRSRILSDSVEHRVVSHTHPISSNVTQCQSVSIIKAVRSIGSHFEINWDPGSWTKAKALCNQGRKTSPEC